MRLTAIVASSILTFSGLVGGIAVSAGTHAPAASQQSVVAASSNPIGTRTPDDDPAGDNNGNG